MDVDVNLLPLRYAIWGGVWRPRDAAVAPSVSIMEVTRPLPLHLVTEGGWSLAAEGGIAVAVLCHRHEGCCEAILLSLNDRPGGTAAAKERSSVRALSPAIDDDVMQLLLSLYNGV